MHFACLLPIFTVLTPPVPSHATPPTQVSETTNDLYNETLFDFVTPKGGLSWSRVITCNALATTAVQWAACFSEYNGGTYRYACG